MHTHVSTHGQTHKHKCTETQLGCRRTLRSQSQADVGQGAQPTLPLCSPFRGLLAPSPTPRSPTGTGRRVAGAGAELALTPLPPHSTGQEAPERDRGGSRRRGGLRHAQPLPFPCAPLPLSSPSLCSAVRPPPTPLGGQSLCWKNPGAWPGASFPTSHPSPGVQGAGGPAAREPRVLRSDCPPPPIPTSSLEAPGMGREGSGPEDRTSSWQHSGRQAGGSQPQSRPQGEKVTGARGSPAPRPTRAPRARPSHFKQWL